MVVLQRDRYRRNGCPWGKRARIDQHTTRLEPQSIGVDALDERRRRAAVLWFELPTVPGAGQTTIDHFALVERPTLMRAHAMHGRYVACMSHHRDAFRAGHAQRPRAIFGDRLHRTGVQVAYAL